ncbi:MAG: hypothetical protein JXB04_06230 [Kiritimatiellae bacterium]|nr:hypothetical protein [Kiritimatiellia bacterium]
MAGRDISFKLPLALMVVLGFVVGFFLSFGLAGMLGFPSAFFWPALVIIFLIGVMFLQAPKLYLWAMFLFYACFATFASFGGVRVIPIELPMERLLDEIFLAVPLAVIIMHLIQRTNPKEETGFGLFFPLLAVLSWYFNKAPTLNALRVTLSYMKLYILWYFVRCIGPWSHRERRFMFRAFVTFALLQFVANVLMWQHGIVPTVHPDYSVGTVGGAHFVGYIAAFGLFMLAAWILLPDKKRSLPATFLGFLAILVSSYNLIFMTDTKHALFVMPIAVMPLLLHPRLGVEKRMVIIISGALFVGASYLYFLLADIFAVFPDVGSTWKQIQLAGKGATLRIIFTELPKEIPFWPLGAGPGNYCSTVALFSMRPLAVKYVMPYTMWAYGGLTAISTSFLGGPSSGFFTLLGEFGIISTGLFYYFWRHVIRHLWRRSCDAATDRFEAAQQAAIVCCLIFFLVVNFLFEVFTIHVFMLTLAALVGAYWDNPKQKPAPASAARPVRLPRPVSRI